MAVKAAQSDSAARNTAFAFIAQMTTAAFTAGVVIFLVRTLGPKEFGVFSLALGIAMVLMVPADLGIASSAARYIAERRDRLPMVASLLLIGGGLRLLFSLVFALGLFFTATPIAHAYAMPELVWTLRGMALALFGQSIFQFSAHSMLTAVGRLSVTVRAVLFESLVEAGATIGLVVAGLGAVGAAFGRGIGYTIGGVAGVVLLVLAVGGRETFKKRERTDVGVRQILGYGGVMLIVEGAYALFTQVDAIVIGAILGSTAVGIYQAPARLIALVAYPGLALARGAAPRLAARPGMTPDVGALVASIRWATIAQAFIVVPLFVWADPIVHLTIGGEFPGSVAVLRWLAVYIYLAGFGPIVSSSVSYMGAARWRVPVAVATVVVNLVLDILLVPSMGVVGAALATDVAFIAYVFGHLAILKRLLGFDLAPLAMAVLRTIVPAAAFAGVLFAFGTERLAVWAWIAGVVGGAAVFVGLLLVTRAVRVDEARRMAYAVRGVFGRVRAVSR